MTYAEAMVYSVALFSVAQIICVGIFSIQKYEKKPDEGRTEMIRALVDLTQQMAKLQEPKVSDRIPMAPKKVRR